MKKLVSLVFVSLAFVACAPSTTFNRGINVDYRPSGEAKDQARLVGSAVPIAIADKATLTGMGAVYLGELEMRAERDDNLTGGSSGAKNLEGRASLEAAQRGATHFYNSESKIDKQMSTGSSTSSSALLLGRNGQAADRVQVLTVRYALYRVEEDKWAGMTQELRPDALAK